MGLDVKQALVVPWGSAGVPRSVRGRPSQVKGAFGVADAMPLRGTLDLRASTAPAGRIAGRPGACPYITRGTPADPHWSGQMKPPWRYPNRTRSHAACC
jgi:hypothetical protein